MSDKVVDINKWRAQKIADAPQSKSIIFEDWMLYASDIEFQGLPVEEVQNNKEEYDERDI